MSWHVLRQRVVPPVHPLCGWPVADVDYRSQLGKERGRKLLVAEGRMSVVAETAAGHSDQDRVRGGVVGPLGAEPSAGRDEKTIDTWKEHAGGIEDRVNGTPRKLNGDLGDRCVVDLAEEFAGRWRDIGEESGSRRCWRRQDHSGGVERFQGDVSAEMHRRWGKLLDQAVDDTSDSARQAVENWGCPC